ncbi:DUF1905 domain-containing protein [Microlunatus speluncae]|uniref:DUF1905 domain-containing protein n=1 Tax=Microlunatus speluncae TaxID=2594267 RepID=UPI001FE69725|nr:DUF1905 domain-containing protein [Microlunatus speluncae]
MGEIDGLTFEFSGAVWHWRGPSPYYFVTVPEEESAVIQELKAALTYGWGVIPVKAQIGDTEWTTSLFPKDGGYALPLKDAVRKAEDLSEGSVVDVIMAPTRSP